ncbi:Rne/Rng family ribonuclease [Microbacterium gorillae]|uniref:Rne/Rng family ribonuclease n=1 Tax=Microbacterium gorillae TaxID=1231063 RepID=UPI003D9610DA
MAETKSENDRTSDSGANDDQHGLPAGGDGELFGDHTALPAFGGPADDADADPTEPVGEPDADPSAGAETGADDGETVIESDAGIIVISDEPATSDDTDVAADAEAAPESQEAAAAGDEAAAATLNAEKEPSSASEDQASDEQASDVDAGESTAPEQATSAAPSNAGASFGLGDDVVVLRQPAPEAEPEPEPLPTAVSLGLLPEVFVSQVSTALHFYAPEIVPLPALPADEDEGGSSRRRRRRGESDDSGDVRRRTRTVEYITEPKAIKGSTRLEAKKQRRRDGREAGRRRAVVTEAEFLARREAVDRQMIVRSKNGRIQIGVLEDKVLVEHYVARNQDASLIGNVYIGRVQNVLPSMEAAFVDIGRGRNAVLYSGEVDWDSVETGNQPRRIELALKTGDKVLVQVTKDPVGHKGARLTSQISLPGRYLVYVPNGSMNGISRKLPDTERARLKRILKEVLPESSGVIVRTAAEGATEEQLTVDVRRLTSQWERIAAQATSGHAPQLLHSEPDLLVKIVRDVFNEDFQKLIIQGDEAQQTIESYLRGVAPDLLERVERYEGDRDPFDEYRITEQIEKALDRKVWLPSGGSLVIDRTEAMTVVDVNTGKFVGSGGNLEETVTKNNLEAAEEIVRQLRLRDIGGIIVIDFIDMVLESNRDLVLRRLVECLSRDRTKHQVAEVTSLGLVQMTRKKLGLGLLETFSEPCEVCAGRGVVVHHDPVVKHRAPVSNGNGGGGGNGSSRRSRGGSNGGGGASTPAPQVSTHVITEGAKSALAQIAASTRTGVIAEAAPVDVTDLVLPEAPTPERSERSERTKRPRKKRNGSNGNSVNGADKPKSEKEQLLESVLDALPEPKAPGQGRGRRRVTTAALTGTPVSTTPVLGAVAEPAGE